MPIMPCQKNGKKGKKWGKSGKCYTGKDKDKKVDKQRKAIKANKKK